MFCIKAYAFIKHLRISVLPFIFTSFKLYMRTPLIVIMSFILFLLSSCESGKKKQDSSRNNKENSAYNILDNNEATSSPEISIDLELASLPKGDYMYYKMTEENGFYKIEPTSPYYDKYITGQELELLSWYYNEDGLENVVRPKLLCYISNNTNKPLSISRLDIKVSDSKLDNLPYIYLCENDFSFDQDLNKMFLINQGWTRWNKMTLEYSLLKKGESFNGHYKKTKVIPYFDEEKEIDFTQDLREMGYDYMRNLADRQEEVQNIEYRLSKYADVFFPFECTSEVDLVDNVYGGFARIHGRLRFDNRNLIVKFHGKIYLSAFSAYGGQVNEPEDFFDVVLKEKGKDYIISYPFNSTIKPNDTKMVAINIRCAKSSNHSFIVSAINDNGIDISSMPVKMHFMKPRDRDFISVDKLMKE